MDPNNVPQQLNQVFNDIGTAVPDVIKRNLSRNAQQEAALNEMLRSQGVDPAGISLRRFGPEIEYSHAGQTHKVSDQALQKWVADNRPDLMPEGAQPGVRPTIGASSAPAPVAAPAPGGVRAGTPVQKPVPVPTKTATAAASVGEALDQTKLKPQDFFNKTIYHGTSYSNPLTPENLAPLNRATGRTPIPGFYGELSENVANAYRAPVSPFGVMGDSPGVGSKLYSLQTQFDSEKRLVNAYDEAPEDLIKFARESFPESGRVMTDTPEIQAINDRKYGSNFNFKQKFDKTLKQVVDLNESGKATYNDVNQAINRVHEFYTPHEFETYSKMGTSRRAMGSVEFRRFGIDAMFWEEGTGTLALLDPSDSVTYLDGSKVGRKNISNVTEITPPSAKVPSSVPSTTTVQASAPAAAPVQTTARATIPAQSPAPKPKGTGGVAAGRPVNQSTSVPSRTVAATANAKEAAAAPVHGSAPRTIESGTSGGTARVVSDTVAGGASAQVSAGTKAASSTVDDIVSSGAPAKGFKTFLRDTGDSVSKGVAKGGNLKMLGIGAVLGVGAIAYGKARRNANDNIERRMEMQRNGFNRGA
jgi:hypothetical protein